MGFKRPAPRVGWLITSIGAFDNKSKDVGEDAVRNYFEQLVAAGSIDAKSLIRGRVTGPHEAMAAADDFAAAQVDLVVVSNIAFPNGQVFLTLATHPHLANIPIAVHADPEAAGGEWLTNAWCGAIMNNHVAVQLGRHLESIPGPLTDPRFKTEFDRLLRVAGTIKGLRNCYILRFGDAPGGFHCATGDQIAFAKTFGTRVDTVDLSQVMQVYETGIAKGHLGESTFTDKDVRETAAMISKGREVQVSTEMLERGVRMYHAVRAMLRAGGYTAAAFRCWPEVNEKYIGISSCMSVSLLLGNGDATGAACEADWPTAVLQTIGTLLSDAPAACLDLVNYTAGSDIVQLGHCGVGICGHMAKDSCKGSGRSCDTIGLQPVERRAGNPNGPVHLGQYEYGPKTGFGMTHDKERFKMLAFRGVSSPDTNQDMIYSAADMRVPEYVQLNRLILQHGFPHHVAMAFKDITADLKMLCGYLGIEYISPQ